jgi:uncharacterized RDD family membrane protein YckC
MTIEFHCPGCDKKLSTSDERVGWQASCPECTELVTVPHQTDAPVAASSSLDHEARPFGDTVSRSGSRCPMCGGELQSSANRCTHCGEGVDTEKDVPAVRDLEYAGFGVRLIAFLIDYVIGTLIPSIVISVPITLIGGYHNPLEDEAFTVSTIFAFFISWIYHAVMNSSARQATLGKMAMGLIVTDTDGRRITFARAAGRPFAKILSGMFCCAGYIMAAFTERHQALHDFICGTLVVRA